MFRQCWLTVRDWLLHCLLKNSNIESLLYFIYVYCILLYCTVLYFTIFYMVCRPMFQIIYLIDIDNSDHKNISSSFIHISGLICMSTRVFNDLCSLKTELHLISWITGLLRGSWLFCFDRRFDRFWYRRNQSNGHRTRNINSFNIATDGTLLYKLFKSNLFFSSANNFKSRNASVRTRERFNFV